YSLIGNSGIAIAPATKITIDSTAAKIGRSMKNLEKLKGASPYGLRLGSALIATRLGLTLLSGAKIFWRPATMTLSFASRPDCTTRKPSWTLPSRSEERRVG